MLWQEVTREMNLSPTLYKSDNSFSLTWPPTFKHMLCYYFVLLCSWLYVSSGFPMTPILFLGENMHLSCKGSHVKEKVSCVKFPSLSSAPLNFIYFCGWDPWHCASSIVWKNHNKNVIACKMLFKVLTFTHSHSRLPFTSYYHTLHFPDNIPAPL